MSIKKSLKDVVVLLVICAVFAVILAAVNSVTAPIIADRLNAAADEAYMAVIPGAKGFESVDLSTYTLPGTVKEAKRETSGLGYAIKLETKGYASGMVLIIGVTGDGVVTGATCISSNETWGLEKTVGDEFIGKDISNAVDVIAGVTSLTVNAYYNAVKDAINSVAIFGGAVVDTRTDAEIFADNLKAALPASEGELDRFFITEVIEGVKTIYKAKNDTGYVCIIGEGADALFVGIDAEGNSVAVVNAVTEPVESADEAIATAKAAVEIVSASVSEDIDITEYVNSEDRNIKRTFRSVNSVKKTATGNYVLEVKATGYGSDPIVVLISITADGTIIDVYTVSNNETANLGGMHLVDGAYNSNFMGKTETEAADVPTIGGCTVTTAAFKKAVQTAFDAIIVIEGGAN